MCQLFETIQLHDGQLLNLDYHNERLNKSRFELFSISEPIDLQDFIEIYNKKGIYRCRVNYGEVIMKVEFFSYQIKPINRIKIIENTEISYPHKFENRDDFQALLTQNPSYDEVIISQKNYLTDATFANLAFFDGTTWFTPSTYLLKGTKRSYLLDNQLIKEEKIKVSDIKNFKKIALINAMRGLEIALDISVIC